MSARVLVCGSRDWDDDQAIWDVLCGLKHHGIEIIAGGARGVDTIAARWAKANKVPFHEFKAEWNRYGRAAGYERNQRMLDEGKPDVVWAFKTKPQSKGTDMMVILARSAGVSCYVVEKFEDARAADMLLSVYTETEKT